MDVLYIVIFTVVGMVAERFLLTIAYAAFFCLSAYLLWIYLAYMFTSFGTLLKKSQSGR